ncbi:hypothetical protein JCM8097_005534 [Rhodosporidiobolus ruineniae]
MGWIACLEYLPTLRKGFLGALLLSGGTDLLASIVLLAYQLALTEGYQHAVPALVATSFLCVFLPVWFLFSRPYSIKLPLSPNLAADPKVGSMRDKVAKASRSIAAEVICLGGLGAWVLVAVSNLHAETPGLINHCGGFAICRMLLAVLALTWITFLFLGLSFASLLISTLYFTLRRHSPMPIFQTSFNAVDWERYAGRPVNRSNTVRLPKRSKAERERERARESSVVPVLPTSATANSLNMSVISSTTYGGGASGRGGLDWDVQSSMTAPTIPWGDADSRPASMMTTGSGVGMGLAEMAELERRREESGSSSAAGGPKEDSVFVLMEDDPVEEQAKTAAQEVKEQAEQSVGAAK